MSTSGRKNVLAICDTCGFRYKLNQLKKNSMGMMQCPKDYDGSYDLKSHPQNKSPRIEERYFIRDARPEGDGGINLQWQQATSQWNANLKYWNLI
jgi:hypothetical protein